MYQLLPEWHPQWGVLLAWPHLDSDWADNLDQAEQTYCALSHAILQHENLLIICRDAAHEQHIREQLDPQLQQNATTENRVHFRHRPYNDTWARDFGPIAVTKGPPLTLLDFTFNGWGEKFPSQQDNALSASLDWRVPLHSIDMVLEGGALETDGNGTLLTTTQCLLNRNRNPQLSKADIEEKLTQLFGLEKICWLTQGHLEGDDTDAHIDTLARFCDPQTLAYVQCTDRSDSHYHGLAAMEQELQALSQQHGWKLLPLPHPPAQYASADQQHSENGNVPLNRHRLPATYANFLIINGAVLVPQYHCETDALALNILKQAFAQRQVIGIPCGPLIEQHGSLHCITMQLPEGVL